MICARWHRRLPRTNNSPRRASSLTRRGFQFDFKPDCGRGCRNEIRKHLMPMARCNGRGTARPRLEEMAGHPELPVDRRRITPVPLAERPPERLLAVGDENEMNVVGRQAIGKRP